MHKFSMPDKYSPIKKVEPTRIEEVLEIVIIDLCSEEPPCLDVFFASI
jgi:hypothetical protein